MNTMRMKKTRASSGNTTLEYSIPLVLVLVSVGVILIAMHIQNNTPGIFASPLQNASATPDNAHR